MTARSKKRGNNQKKKQKQKQKPAKEQEQEKERKPPTVQFDESSDSDEQEKLLPAKERSSKKQTKESESEEGSSSNDDDKSSDDDSSSSSSDDNDDHANDAPIFSDKNASWLKPKKKQQQSSSLNQLLSSDEENQDEEHDDDEEEEEEDDDELLEIEQEAQLIDQEDALEEREAAEEYERTVRDHTSIYHLPTEAELERDVDRVVPPSELKSHVDSILEVLAEFQQRREPGRSRKEYIDRLAHFVSELYGYLPELVEYFLTMLGPTEAVEFIDQSDRPRPMVIRTNTLKARRKDLAAALMKRGVTLDPLASWSKVGLKIIESPVPIGATPEYLSGMYMLQSAASMCPVLALSPQPSEKVLDVSAAPGGKTSYIAQLMRNTGVIVANDLKAERQKATVANMHRLGVKNVIACKHDGRKMGTLFKNRFDRILLDAPCSGLGVISRDPSVKVQRTIADVNKCAHLQKELLLAAIDALKYKGTSGGVMVYSTCSVSVAENEEVVNYALSKRDIKIIDTGLDFGKPGFTRFQQKRFHPSVALTRRFYPHVHNMDGFFVAKIQKLSDKIPGNETPTEVEGEEDVAMETSEETKSEVKKKKSEKADKKGKKRKESGEVEENKAVKNPRVSIPPQRIAPKKSKKQSAKVTKPRRKPAATDA